MHLQVALQGTAQQVLWTDGRVEWTCEELLNELSKRFSPESQVDQYRAMLFRGKETAERLSKISGKILLESQLRLSWSKGSDERNIGDRRVYQSNR